MQQERGGDVGRIRGLRRMEEKSFIRLPPQARSLETKHAKSGFDACGKICWVFASRELNIWEIKDKISFLASANLPYVVFRPLVSIVTLQTSVAALICTTDGNLFVWPTLAAHQEPLPARISQEVTCMVSTDVPNQGLVSVVGAADGKLYRLDCTTQMRTSSDAQLSVTPLQPAEKGLMQSLNSLLGSRMSPAAKHAVCAIQLVLHGEIFQIFALNKSVFDCWQMGAQPGTPAQLLWSHPVLSGMQQHAQNAAQLSLCSLSTVSMSGNRHNVAVLATASDGTVALQLLSVSLKAKPEELSTHIMNLGEDRDMQGSGKASKWSCCCSRQGEVLIWREGGSAYKWTLLTGLVQQSISNEVYSAVAMDEADSPHWLLMTPTKVLHLPIEPIKPARSVVPSKRPATVARTTITPVAPSSDKATHHTRKGGSGQQTISQDQVFQLLTTAVYNGPEDPERRSSLEQLSRMVPRLQEPPGPANDVAIFSTRVIDVLPKQWGRAVAADYLQQLHDKEAFHQTLLTVLEGAHVLHVLDPEALRILFESAEKLETVSAVREYENLQLADSQMETLTILQDVIFDAGRRCVAPVSQPVEQRSEQEVFYSCPSTSAEAFFEAVTSQLAGLEDSTYAATPSTQLEQAVEIAQAVQNLLNKTHARHQELSQAYQQEMFRVSTDTPWWSAGLAVRTCLHSLADTLARLAQLLQTSNPAHFEKSVSWLLTVTETMLNCFTKAMASCQAAAALQALQHNYEQSRQRYLQQLLDIAQSLGEEGGSSNLVRKVEQLADAHRAYAQLFEVCRLQDNDPKLHGYMMRHRIMLQGNHLDLEQSAVAYVFDRLLEEGLHARLLSFPDQFNQDLNQWLQKRLAAAGSNLPRTAALRRLTWLHKLRMKQYSAASRTLADVTNNKEGDAATVHRAACIAKLTKLADVKGSILKPSQEDLDYVSHAHTTIIMLQVQEALHLGSDVVHPLDHLLTACLQDAAPPSQACYVFLLLGHLQPVDRQQAYRTEFEAAWQKLVAATDWQQLAQRSRHLSDDEIGYFLSQTDVCHAAQLCYLDDDCHVRQSFAPESVTELLLEQAGSAMDAAAKQLIQGAFARGLNGQYSAPLMDDADMGSPIDMQAD